MTLLPRTIRRTRISPLLGLPAFRLLLALPRSTLEPFGAVLRGLRNEAAAQGPRSWRKRKAPMAAYWMAVAAHSGAALRSLLGSGGVARPCIAVRRSVREQRNPVLALPQCTRLASIPSPERARLLTALARVRAEASALADEAWRSAPDAAAFWRSVSVYAGHLARAVAAAAPAEQHELLLLAGGDRSEAQPVSAQ